jgi:Co/Zn/Cd efflux system component
MARFIQLIIPILQHPTPGRFYLGRLTAHLLSNLLTWILVVFSFYCCTTSNSTLLLSVVTVQIAFSFLILLESLLKTMKAGPLESRRLEMTAYCIGGAALLLICIYQFNEAFLSIKAPRNYHIKEIAPAVFCSMAGNLVLVRLLWRSGLIRSRVRAFCQPLMGILFLNLFNLLASIAIQFTQYFLLDAFLSILISIVLFLIAGSMMIDAYWHLADLEKKGLKKKEIRAR